MNRIAAHFLLFLGAGLLAACGQPVPDTEPSGASRPDGPADAALHVYNWSDYIGADTLAAFTRETGIQVVYDVFDSNEVLEARLLAGASGYDVVVPSNAFLARQIKAGVFRPLDRTQLPNWHNLDPLLLNTLKKNDPGNQHAVPYLWGTVGIGYNTERVRAALGDGAPLDSWDLVFDPARLEKLRSCGVAFLDSAAEILPAALHYLGLPTDSSNPDDLKRAEGLMQAIRPSITYFHSSKYIADLANGDICLAVGYSGDIYQARARAEEAGNGIQVRYSLPAEGAGSFFDMLAIPADARHVSEAHAFINFLMRPEVIAAITNQVHFPNGNAAATPLVSAAIRNDPGVYPGPALRQKLYTYPDLAPVTMRAMTRSWTRIKAGR